MSRLTVIAGVLGSIAAGAGADGIPARGPCEITAHVRSVAGTHVVLLLETHGSALIPGSRMEVVQDERGVATLIVQDSAGGQATCSVVAGAAEVAVGQLVFAPCPIVVTAIGERGGFLALPSGHGLSAGTHLTAWREGVEVGEYELAFGEGHTALAVPKPAGGPAPEPGDVCYAMGDAGGTAPRVPPGGEAADAGELIVTAVDGDWAYLSFGTGGGSAPLKGTYAVKRLGEIIAVLEAAADGPRRGRITVVQAGYAVSPGDMVERLTGNVALTAPPPRATEDTQAGPEPPTPGGGPKTDEPGRDPQPTKPAETDVATPSTAVAQDESPRVAAVPDGDDTAARVGQPGTSPSDQKAPPLGATFHGPTGLIRTPNAEVVPEGSIRLSVSEPSEVLGSTIPDFREQMAFNIGFLPRMEFGGAYNNDPWRDITLHGKFQLLPERRGWPSVAVGASNVRPAAGRHNRYIVGSKTLLDGRVRASLGYSQGSLDGVFGGTEIRLTDWATAVAEYDSKRVNAALRLTPKPRVQIDLANMAGGFAIQGAYTFPMDGSGGQEAPLVELSRTHEELHDQAIVDGLAEAILALGMENVRVTLGEAKRGLTAGIEYENRRYYRDETEPLGLVLATAAQALPERVKRMSIVVLDHQVPVLRISMPVGDYLAYLRGDTPANRFRDMIYIDRDVRPDLPEAGLRAATKRAAPTDRTADVSVTPAFRTLFGSEEVTLAVRHALRPEIDLDLGGGWSLRAAKEVHTGGHLGILLDSLENEDFANLNYTFRPSSSLIGHVAGGEFADKRRGFAAEGFLAPGGSGLLLRGFAGWLNDHRFKYAGAAEWTYHGDVRYWLEGLDAEAEFSFGRYLDSDDGFALSLRRFFGDNELRFTYRDTDYASTMMLQATVPIGPKRYSKPDPVRLRVGDRLEGRWRSVVSTTLDEGTVYTASLAGNKLRFFDMSDAFLNRDRFNANYILGHVDMLRTTAARSVERAP